MRRKFAILHHVKKDLPIDPRTNAEFFRLLETSLLLVLQEHDVPDITEADQVRSE